MTSVCCYVVGENRNRLVFLQAFASFTSLFSFWRFFKGAFPLILLATFAVGGLVHSATVSASEEDPLEKVNRKVFKFNDRVDRYSLKPIAKVYKKITPSWMRAGVSHFFSNLNDVSVTVNDLLQFKFAQAGSDSIRFALNTTVGLLGTVDVASKLNFPKHDEDFGQTLGKWGLPAGPYIVLPLLGPYTTRGTLAYPAENYLSYYPHVSEPADRNVALAVEYIDKRAKLLAAEAFISGDRYAFVRDAYLQQREFLTQDGAVDDGFLDYEDEDDFYDEEFE
ncbi:MAG: VacJ family lipoprotein [Pseudomonadales bacterium]|nr:VacJ family lipoprotein [Pseudomonadales bacterium]